MNFEVVEVHYFWAREPVLLVLGAICLVLAAAGAALLYRLFKSKR